MNSIASYGVYQQNNYDNSVNGKKDKDTAKTGRKESTGVKNNQLKLSRGAEKLLKELRNKYSNMDFIVADYETEEEAQSYLSRGTKEYSVLIDPETLEEMAADSETKEKYLGVLEDATDQLSSLKEQLKDEGNNGTAIRFGISIDKDGTVSYFAELEKMTEKQRERIEEAREERAGERSKEKRANRNRPEGRPEDFIAPERRKRTRVTADSVEGLIEQIKSVDWSSIKNGEPPKAGGRFDFSI